METGLRGKVVAITGGGGGIGRACALAFAAEGATVVVSDVNLPAAQAVAAEVERLGCQASAVQTDVSDFESVRSLFNAILTSYARVDVLVNGAGIFHATPITELTGAQWDQLMAINLKGAFLCAQAAVKIMVEQRSGKIVSIASLAGQVGGIVAGADYAASKAGIICLTKSLAKFAGPFGINVNCVNPGVIDTPMTRSWERENLEAAVRNAPLHRLGTAEDVAGVVVFLASTAASFVHGAHVDINGGTHMD